MKLLFLCVALLPLITADDAKPCCMPRKLEGKIFGTQELSLFDMARDADLKMIVLRNAKDKTDPSYTLIDYGKRLIYRRSKDYSCTKTTILQPQMFSNCVPANAKLLAPSHYGPPGVLPINTFVFTMGNIKMEMMMSVDRCYPVVNRLFGPNSPNGEALNIFLSLKPTISDMNVFNVDTSNCTAPLILG
ncbi:uncharacterized protein LOC101861994 [Aplysia californica]|uniref:Uncharacterized protein LOC101861994 n=1 Tax=Aplysia californica TaxID=6500 RepID=A0ABM1ABK5_APLCA|nr:uncharacterized protein LOC101861994 [Aplysia californica]